MISKPIKILLLLSPLISFKFSHAQRCDRTLRCEQDTFMYEDWRTGERFLAQSYSRVGLMGIRFEMAYTRYHYSPSTAAWLGNHGGGFLGVALAVKNLELGIRLKTFSTVNPHSEINFGKDTLIKKALLNPNRVEYFMGYSINLKHLFTIAPYAGLCQARYVVVNNDELEKKVYGIPKTIGFATGVTLNKYFTCSRGEFFGMFLNFAYTNIDYRKIHPGLGHGNTEWGLGITYKVFGINHSVKRIQPGRVIRHL